MFYNLYDKKFLRIIQIIKTVISGKITVQYYSYSSNHKKQEFPIKIAIIHEQKPN